MGEILGLGTTHYPPLTGLDENMAGILRRCLEDPDLPQQYRDPANWPAQLREEYGDDGGTAAAERHRQYLVRHFRRARQVLDEFRPDLVIIWGDDQYENFKEDIIPPFCVQAYEEIVIHPFAHRSAPNAWGEGPETEFRYQGHREAGKYLARRLLEQHIDMAYAYQPLHDELGHAFTNTLLFLDYDRQGFPYRVLPFQVNCYGSKVIAQRGGRGSLANPKSEGELDPPSPTPARCMEVGAAVARAMRESPWKVTLVASSSWSHAFLVDKNYQLWPDLPADRQLYEALCNGDYDVWRKRPLSSYVESGEQEMMNWAVLIGAMEALGRKPDVCEFVESAVFNSNKVFAVFRP
jgi:hypothetical protein